MKIFVEGKYTNPGSSGVSFSGLEYTNPAGVTNFTDELEIDEVNSQSIDRLVVNYLDQKKKITSLIFENRSDYLIFANSFYTDEPLFPLGDQAKYATVIGAINITHKETTGE